MHDLAITGGLAVTANGTGPFDVGIANGRIATLAPAGMLGASALRTLDASGKIIVPGGVDPHIHSKWPMPRADGQILEHTADIEQVSRAALFGGTTTLIDFAPWDRDCTLAESIERRSVDFRRSHCDYAYHVMLSGSVPSAILDEIHEIVEGGHPSIKIFTTDITPSRRGRRVPFGDVWEVVQRLATAGGIAAIHAEDDELVMHMYDRLEREGRTHFTNMPEVHSELSEELAFRRVIGLAEHIEGAALYMMHVSAATGVEAIAESRAKGNPIFGETLHQYALFSAEDAYFRQHGQIYHTYPSLKYDRDRDALWDGMTNGTIGAIATDELCTLLGTKLHGSRIDDVTGGNSGVEPRMGIMFTEAVTNRGFSLENFVDLTSANAARYLGLYPKKGAIAVGSDADLCVIDPSARFVLRKEHLHETDYSPWEGWEIKGWPIATIANGNVAVEKGVLNAKPGDGQWVRRKLSERALFGG